MAVVKLKKYKEICVQFKLRNGEDAWIRNMRDSDVETVHELECLVFEDPWSFSNFRHEVSRSAVSWPLVVEVNNDLVGYAVPWFVVDELHLANIATSPLYLRHGIARQLMIVILEEALRREIRLAYLEVRPTNCSAICLYEKLGFEQIGMRSRYYRNGEDAIVMQRFLLLQNRKNLYVAD